MADSVAVFCTGPCSTIALEPLLLPHYVPPQLLARFVCETCEVEWGRFLRELGAEIPILEEFSGEEDAVVTAGAAAAVLPAAFRGLSPEQLEAKLGQVVQGIATGILGVDELSGDAPLMEAPGVLAGLAQFLVALSLSLSFFSLL